MVFIRKVRTASGATAVQLAERREGRDRVLEHLGSAHTDAELAALMEIGRTKLHPGQGVLDLDGVSAAPKRAISETTAIVGHKVSRLLIDTIRDAWQTLGLDVIDDEAFFQLVIARIVEPTSVSDAVRVLRELGVSPKHRNSLTNALARCQTRDYRAQLAAACFAHVMARGDVSLLLYDVTTLYFEAEKEDGLRKVGYSKERRVDPQIVVGLLVDRAGFPLQVGCFEGNTAETTTMLPLIRAFQDHHQVADMVVVADAGMLSATNLRELDTASLRFIVGARATKAPHDLASHFRWHGDAFTDGQLIETVTTRTTTPTTKKKKQKNQEQDSAPVNDPMKITEPIWDPAEHLEHWRAIWAYSAKRAARDGRTLTAQENKAKAVIAGEKAARAPRFVRITAAGKTLDEASLARARRLVGLKGYVTNIPAHQMPAAEVIASYHELWHVEQSFRMSKTDLRARPMYHHTREAIEAHLTIVFAALAVSRHLQRATGISIKKIIHTLRPLQDVTIHLNAHAITAAPQISPPARQILNSLTH